MIFILASIHVLCSVKCVVVRYRYPRPPHRFSVALKVGEREFIGEGETLQAARHSAASMALKVLKNLPLPTQEPAAKRNSDDETVNDEAGSVKGG